MWNLCKFNCWLIIEVFIACYLTIYSSRDIQYGVQMVDMKTKRRNSVLNLCDS